MNLKRAHTAALNMNDPFVFQCASGLVQIAYPFAVNGAVQGTIFLGPLIMGLSRNNAIKKLVRDFPNFKDRAPEVISFLSENQTKTALEVSYLYEIFCNCIFSSRLLEKNFMVINNLLHTDVVATAGPSVFTGNYDLIPAELLETVKAGNHDAAQTNFKIFFERAYLSGAGNQNRIRLSLLDLFQFLSENIVSDIFLSEGYLESLDFLKKAILLTELYQISELMISQITSHTARPVYKGSSRIIKSSISYLHEHYDQNITLSQLAQNIHVNPSYLSSLFKKETDMTFSQYLTGIRLAKSLDLLSDTHLSITEISMMCGFSSQSYYIKIFKERYQKTPGDYRKQVEKLNT